MEEIVSQVFQRLLDCSGTSAKRGVCVCVSLCVFSCVLQIVIV